MNKALIKVVKRKDMKAAAAERQKRRKHLPASGMAGAESRGVNSLREIVNKILNWNSPGQRKINRLAAITAVKKLFDDDPGLTKIQAPALQK